MPFCPSILFFKLGGGGVEMGRGDNEGSCNNSTDKIAPHHIYCIYRRCELGKVLTVQKSVFLDTFSTVRF